jgi:cytochrome P450
MLVTKADSFRKSDNYRSLRPLLGDSVITTDGELWRKQRRVIAPEFHESRVREFIPLMDEITRERLARARGESDLSLQGFLCDWGLDVASRSFFGQAPTLEPGKVAWLFNQGARGLFLNSIFRLRGRGTRLNPWSGKLDRGLELVDSWAQSMIKSRRAEVAAKTAGGGCPFPHDEAKGRPQDVLGRIIAGAGAEGESSDRELRDQAVSILMAGHDTTALSLFWAVHLLLGDPASLARAQAEADRVLARSKALDAAGVEQLVFIEQVLLEAIRLYPAVNTMSREALEDVEIGGISIAKGQVVQLAPWVTHRHPSAWEDPGRFDPERFAPGQQEKIPKGAYFPFGLGPRTCVAQSFALAQMKIFLAHFLHEFSVGPFDGKIPDIRPFLTLRPVADTRVPISPRPGHA